MGNIKPKPYYAYTINDDNELRSSNCSLQNSHRLLNYKKWIGYDNNEYYKEIDFVSDHILRSYDLRIIDIVKLNTRDDFNNEIVY